MLVSAQPKQEPFRPGRGTPRLFLSQCVHYNTRFDESVEVVFARKRWFEPPGERQVRQVRQANVRF
jgi:hypothetical protein